MAINTDMGGIMHGTVAASNGPSKETIARRRARAEDFKKEYDPIDDLWNLRTSPFPINPAHVRAELALLNNMSGATRWEMTLALMQANSKGISLNSAAIACQKEIKKEESERRELIDKLIKGGLKESARERGYEGDGESSDARATEAEGYFDGNAGSQTEREEDEMKKERLKEMRANIVKKNQGNKACKVEVKVEKHEIEVDTERKDEGESEEKFVVEENI